MIATTLECTLCGSGIEVDTGLCVACHRSIRFVLIPALGAPIPLVPEARVTFGREVGSSIRIADQRVSRAHAELDWRGSDPWLRDTSRHGTIVNGRPIDDVVLQHGDRVRMGGFRFTVLDRSCEREVLKRERVEATLEGRVSPGSLCELVEALALARKTGRLHVVSVTGERSWLNLSEGVPQRAQRGLVATGDDAALALLATGAGRYVFSEGETGGEGPLIQSSLVTLIHDATRAQERAARAETVLVDGPRGSGSLRAG